MVKDKHKRTIEGIQVSRVEFLKARPVRNGDLTWKKDEKGLHIKLPRKRTSSFRFFSKLLRIRRERQVMLDEQGALVWSLCDGEHQVKEIAKKLSAQYKLRVSDAQNALDLYLVQLSKSGLIGFVIPESARRRYHKRFEGVEKTPKKQRE